MSYELIVGRKTPGDLLNLTNSVTTASWITQRTGNPGKLTFTYLTHAAIQNRRGRR